MININMHVGSHREGKDTCQTALKQNLTYNKFDSIHKLSKMA